jgi:hypothetical protein
MSWRSQRATPSLNALVAGDPSASDLFATHLPRKSPHGARACDRIGRTHVGQEANVAGKAGRYYSGGHTGFR